MIFVTQQASIAVWGANVIKALFLFMKKLCLKNKQKQTSD